jgi:hypothetical protein
MFLIDENTVASVFREPFKNGVIGDLVTAQNYLLTCTFQDVVMDVTPRNLISLL